METPQEELEGARPRAEPADTSGELPTDNAQSSPPDDEESDRAPSVGDVYRSGS